MDLTLKVDIYGFGSHFTSDGRGKDIDILLIHEDVSEASCDFAISCKDHVTKRFSRAHITVLAIAEAQELGFLERSHAHRLGCLCLGRIEQDFESIEKKLLSRNDVKRP